MTGELKMQGLLCIINGLALAKDSETKRKFDTPEPSHQEKNDDDDDDDDDDNGDDGTGGGGHPSANPSTTVSRHLIWLLPMTFANQKGQVVSNNDTSRI